MRMSIAPDHDGGALGQAQIALAQLDALAFGQIDGNPVLEDRFGSLLDLASRVRQQEQRQRGPKIYSLHAPEVECIGKGKARTPYEFGCKVSIVTPVTAPKGGQFVLHAKALHGNPYDGHTLGPVTADLERLTGVAVRRIHEIGRAHV